MTAQRGGYYTAELDLGEPYIYEEYTLSAMVETDGQTISSRTVDLCYNSPCPACMRSARQVIRENGSLCGRTGSRRPVSIIICQMFQCVFRFLYGQQRQPDYRRERHGGGLRPCARTDGVVTLKAEYNSSLNAWVTEEYKCGNNPPQNTWVSYTPATPGLAATAQDLERADAAQANVDSVTEGDVADYKEDFKNMGVSVTWDEDGTPESMTIPANGNTYTITSSTVQGGAAAGIADLPKWEEEPVTADHDKTGATYIVPSGNVVYARVSGPDEAELKYDYIESYDLPDGDQFVCAPP